MRTYFLRRNSQPPFFGPYSWDEIREKVRLGEFDADCEALEALGQTARQLERNTGWFTLGSALTNDIHFQCPHCAGKVVVNEQGAGMDLECPHCSKRMLVPSAKSRGTTSISSDEARVAMRPSMTRSVNFSQPVSLTDVARVLHKNLGSDYTVKLDGIRVTITKGNSAGCAFVLPSSSFWTLKAVQHEGTKGQIRAFLPNQRLVIVIYICKFLLAVAVMTVNWYAGAAVFFLGDFPIRFLLYENSKVLVAEVTSALEEKESASELEWDTDRVEAT